jgi:hypothetical protein
MQIYCQALHLMLVSSCNKTGLLLQTSHVERASTHPHCKYGEDGDENVSQQSLFPDLLIKG